MNDRAHRLGRALAIAVIAATALTTLPAGLAASASPLDCKVHNVDKDISRNSLQRAVWAADAGDTLLVQGTCVGTTRITKDLHIGYMGTRQAPLPLGDRFVIDEAATLRSGSWRPTLIIDPSLDDIRIYRGLTVKQGFVIDEPSDWRGATRATAPRYWTHWGKARPVLGGSRPRTVNGCVAWNASGQKRYGKLPTAIAGAGDGARFVLAGKCWSGVRIDQRVYVHGSRVPGDAGCRTLPDDSTICIDDADFGPPRVKGRIRISADVDEVAFKRLTLSGGIRIR
jgi:hypothetical protein